MPRVPILSREGYYKTLTDGTRVPLDWNLVNTSLGAMLEQRQVVGFCSSPLAAVDAKDASFTREVEYDENVLQFQFSTGGAAVPRDFST